MSSIAYANAVSESDSTGSKMALSIVFHAHAKSIIVSNGGSRIPRPRSVAIRNGLNDRRNQPVLFDEDFLLFFLTADFFRVDLLSEFIKNRQSAIGGKHKKIGNG